MGGCVAGELQAGRCIRPQSLDLCTGCQGVVDTGHDRVGSLAHGLGHHVGGVVDIVEVVASAADHGVDAGAAVQRVVAAETVQGVIAGGADQLVIARSTGDRWQQRRGRRSDLRPWTGGAWFGVPATEGILLDDFAAESFEQDDLRGDRVDDAVAGDLQSLRR
jgi:hypothetical protein